MVNCLLQSMNPKLSARVAYLVDGKAIHQRPAYYDLIKFAVEKEVEIKQNKEDPRLDFRANGHYALSLQQSEIHAPHHTCSLDGSPSPRRGI